MSLIFDTHAHLQDECFREDFAEVLASLVEHGVGRVVLPASDLPDSHRAAELALTHEGLYCVLGVHPHEASSWTEESAQELKALVQETEARGRSLGRERVVVGIGEIGLDYYYDYSPRELQARVYREQIELAHELNLPFVVHEREAFADSYAILAEAKEAGLIDLPFACHCFSGSVESAERLLKLDAYLGFDGPITFKNAKKAPGVLAAMPADRYLLETDSPYLTPEPKRGKRNLPIYISYIAHKAAELRNSSYEEILAENWRNACAFFRLEKQPPQGILQG